ncbi:MAG TPA: YafY family protein [Chloroflexota bacterium]|nr:YafY family protein [Chloroflexota bacterium]
MKAARLLAITLLLQARGKQTARDLGRVLEVSERTIYRDIAALGEARVPVVAEPGPEGGFWLADGYRVDPTVFSGDEAVSLAIGGAILSGIRDVALSATIQQALAKVEAALPPEFRESVRAGRERFLFDQMPWYAEAGEPDAHLPILRSAVLHGRRVRLVYQSRNAADSEERDVDPLGLVCKAGIWYLVGFCLRRGGLRTFRLRRIARMESLALPRASYPDFDLARYWRESRSLLEARRPFPVVVWVDPACAEELLDRPLTILASERFPDGSLVADIDLESFDQALRFALSWGAGLEIRGPAQLREAVAREVSGMAARYIPVMASNLAL